MISKSISILIFVIFTSASISAETRKATAYLHGVNIDGTITFTETENGLHVQGTIRGMPEGRYGFHIHEIGDITTCDASGGHFDPHENTHGGPEHETRHVGDLGNVIFTTDRQSRIDWIDPLMTLRGENNILGRTVVLHEYEDDLGKGDNEESLRTGNAGPRVACGVVGILEPIAPWNSAVSFSVPNLLLFCVSALVMITKL